MSREGGKFTIKAVRGGKGDKAIKPAIAVLSSGGLDSCILLCLLLDHYSKVHPIYIKSSLAWEEVELSWLRRFLLAVSSDRLARPAVLELPMRDLYGEHWSVTGRDMPDYRSAIHENYLPGRNITLLAKASLYCAMRGIPELALGSLSTNPFPDATPEFLRDFARAASRGLDFNLKITAPFLGQSKSEIIARAAHLPLELTFSCISPINSYHCGLCTKCAERREAFRRAAVNDQTFYAQSLPTA